MTHPTLTNTLSSAFFTSWVLLAGCTYTLDPGHIDPDSLEPHLCFDGAEAALVRYSTRCERASAQALVSEVGDGMEFEASAVKALESPCEETPSPAVAVEIQHSALVFDFSKVEREGEFPNADFEGYVIDLALHDHNARLLAVTVNSESTLPLVRDDIYHEPDHIEVNFAGLEYDADGLVKIDLWFADPSSALDVDG